MLLAIVHQRSLTLSQVYVSSRGKELPGNYNHALLSDLFHIQSSRWRNMAGKHLDAFSDTIEDFVEAALAHITPDRRIWDKLWERLRAAVLENKHRAEEELSRLHEDEKQQPITYNHYYTDNVQNARQDSTRKLIKNAMNEASAQDWNGKLHVSNNSVDAEKLLASLQKRIVVNMDAQACTEALSGLSAYYKVIIISSVECIQS